eukprot:CAMPEP_0177169266 /NCGR_PEP_ID=MMETSP0367-20130122/9489_1 /TAXON_ID=447022 ORGANISM="Scrippsiella hangoei-like, Strain SHHI-4" /NCGR_SAMPLE_ID=MMETSP0367 /ASSEMBLY_ACC=CAM_ASM_000362 /LENGTH=498 /DNA_ID=CAMNT_0018615417 /DNA_START=22 /DNA_END=1518 /DNA_ORIENTATION=+
MVIVSKWAIYTLYLVVFVDLFQLTFVFPFIPTIVTAFYDKSDPGAKKEIAASVALLSSLAAIGEMLGSPILGWLSDKIGRRPVLLISTAAAARIVNGLSGGTAGIANTYLVDVTTFEERPGYISNLTAFVGIGLAAGPIVGGWLFALGGVEVACLSAAGVSVVNFVFIFLFIKETNPSVVAANAAAEAEASAAAEGGEATPAATQAPAAPARTKLPLKIWVLFMASFFQSPIFVVFDTFSNLYVTERFYDGDEAKGTALFSHCMAIIGVCLFFVPLFIYKPFLRRVGFNASIIIGSAFVIVGMLINGFATKDWMFMAATVVWAFGFQLSGPVVPILISKMAPPGMIGSAFGLFTSFGNASRVIGPAAMTPLYNWFHPSVFYFLSVSMAIVGAILFWVSVTAPDSPAQAPAREISAVSEGSPCSPASVSSATVGSRGANFARSYSGTASSMVAYGGMPSQLDGIKALLRQNTVPGLERSTTAPIEPGPLLSVQRSQTHG